MTNSKSEPEGEADRKQWRVNEMRGRARARREAEGEYKERETHK